MSYLLFYIIISTKEDINIIYKKCLFCLRKKKGQLMRFISLTTSPKPSLKLAILTFKFKNNFK